MAERGGNSMHSDRGAVTDKTLGQIAYESCTGGDLFVKWDRCCEETKDYWEAIAAAVAAAVKEEDARICEATRRALEENRAVWAANPMLTPDEGYIADWESSACRGEEYAADIRASIKEVK